MLMFEAFEQVGYFASNYFNFISIYNYHIILIPKQINKKIYKLRIILDWNVVLNYILLRKQKIHNLKPLKTLFEWFYNIYNGTHFAINYYTFLN